MFAIVSICSFSSLSSPALVSVLALTLKLSIPLQSLSSSVSLLTSGKKYFDTYCESLNRIDLSILKSSEKQLQFASAASSQSKKYQLHHDSSDMIRINDLSISYDGNQVFSNLNLKLNTSKHYCIVGPSGSGKSSLLNTLSGLLPLQKGRIGYASSIFDSEPERLINVAYVQQLPSYFTHDPYLFLSSLGRLSLKYRTVLNFAVIFFRIRYIFKCIRFVKSISRSTPEIYDFALYNSKSKPSFYG